MSDLDQTTESKVIANFFAKKIHEIFPFESINQVSESGYLQNYEALQFLKEQQAHWDRVLVVSGGFAIGSLIFPLPVIGLAGGIGALASVNIATPIDRLISVMEVLLESFGDEGITLTPRVKTQEGIVDLLVKMPDKRTFSLALRSKGDSTLKWREDRQDFFIATRKKNKSRVVRWPELNELGKELNKMVLELKKEKSILLGITNSERNKLVVKVLVLTGHTRINLNNSESLFADFGKFTKEDKKVLRIQTDSVFHVVDKDNLPDYLRVPEKTGDPK